MPTFFGLLFHTKMFENSKNKNKKIKSNQRNKKKLEA